MRPCVCLSAVWARDKKEPRCRCVSEARLTCLRFEDGCSPLLQQQRSYSDTILRGAQVVVLLCGCFLFLLTIRNVAPSSPSPAAVVLADLELPRLPEAKKVAKSVEIVYRLGAERSGKKQNSDVARLLEFFAESSGLVGHPIDSVISAATSLGSALGFSPQYGSPKPARYRCSTHGPPFRKAAFPVRSDPKRHR